MLIDKLTRDTDYNADPRVSLSSNSGSFKYKTSITESAYNVDAGESSYEANKVGKDKTEVVIPLKHLKKFKYCTN